ncbi:hypothetical protein P9139_02370 [Curtobacterium flaccumfaciens]|nr:hypothetical protein P9139_02370 [Curtobacterium flaccumfaciens]
MNFRREFGAISGLSVLLVIASSLVLGLFFAWVIPGLGFWWGSPSARSSVRPTPSPPRS